MNNQNPSSEGKTKNITLKSILAWIFGIIFSITGIVNLFSSPISALFFLLTVVILIPPIMRAISQKFKFNLSRNVKIVLVIGLLALAGFNMKSSVSTSTPVVTAPNPVQNSAPTKPAAPLTLEDKIRNSVNASLGSQNMDKVRIVGISVDKYKPVELSDYGYKNTDVVSGILIKINADENITTNLQKGTIYTEAVKTFQAIFPLDSSIGDVVIWAQLPVKDRYGNLKDDTAITFAMSRQLYQKINWTNFDPRDLPALLNSEGRLDDRNGSHELINF